MCRPLIARSGRLVGIEKMTTSSGPSSAPRLVGARELARVAAEVLGASPLPGMVIDVATQRIVAVSLRAAQLLSPDGGSVVGHSLEDYASDSPSHAPGLIFGGRLNGFETMRVLRRRRGHDVTIRMWIRQFDHTSTAQYVLAIIVAALPDTDVGQLRAEDEIPAVIGTVNAALAIERISIDAEALFGCRVADLIGSPLLGWIAEDDGGAAFLGALTEASATNRGVTLTVGIRRPVDPSADPLQCEMMLLPVEPASSCVFVILPAEQGLHGLAVSDSLSMLLGRLSRGAQIAELARGIFRGIGERDLPGLNSLTTRELEILTAVLEGDRPPGIAGNLCLSQSTVRNHLSAIFAKIGVSSQQELVDAFRAAQTRRELH